jgi:phosphoglycolate phosphatase/putative hydrolase of the HAD superfamily
LDALVSAGIKVGVYSDYPVQSKLQSLGIAKYVDAALSAADDSVIGFKPRSNGYRLVSTLLGLRPEEVLYVGDRPEIDGAGAAAAGMQTAIISRRPHRRDGKYSGISTLTQIIDLMQDRAGSYRCNHTPD